MDATQGAALLARTGWLSRTSGDFQRAILAAAQWRRLEPGTPVGIAGDETGGIWGLAAGQLDVINAMVAPDSPIADMDLPGTWGGFAPLFGSIRRANTSARTPVLLATVAIGRVQSMLHDQPHWWEYFGQLAFERAQRWGGGMADLLIRDSTVRCVAVLLRLANCRFGDAAAPVVLTMAHSEFAAMANLSRHTSGEILRRLEADALITLGYRAITVRNAAALRAMVDG